MTHLYDRAHLRLVRLAFWISGDDLARGGRLAREALFIRIDRRSIYGNPFKMKREADRTQVIEQYRLWLDAQRNDAASLVWPCLKNLAEAVARGEDISLVCWCAPKPCHGDILRERILEMAKGLVQP